MSRIFQSLRFKVIIIFLLFILSVSLLDKLIFNKLLYSFPNELEWDTSHWYNFQHSRINLKPFLGESRGVIITGSSVGLYSALPELIEKSLQEMGKIVSVRFYSHVAMSPTDFYHYTDDIISKKPSLVVYPLNPADFQFDYFTPEDTSNFNMAGWVKYNGERQPVRSFYPLEFALQYHKELSTDVFFLLLSKSLLYVNRERSFLLDPLYAYNDRHFRFGRSYHNYTGITPQEGIWRKGWTKPKFTIQCEVSPNGSDFREEYIYTELPETEVSITKNGIVILNEKFQKSGWKEIKIPLDKAKTNELITIETKNTVSSRQIDPKSYSKEVYYGVRLSQNFCRNEFQRNISFQRREVLEDITLSNMTEEEYVVDYNNRLFLNIEKRPELYRQNWIRSIKQNISTQEFSPWIEFDYFQKAIQKLKKHNINIVIINIPENPLERKFYLPSKWYAGYDNYMKKISSENKVRYIDNILSLEDPRYFIDINHLTYAGAKTLSEEYVNLIKESLNE
jgi:hypothetical protein